MSALFAALSGIAVSQSFFVPTSYRGAFAPAPEPMWTDTWANWDPQNTVYGNPDVTVTTSITTNTTWTANHIYLLQGQIYVKNGATLTIEPGTKIMGDKNVAGSGLFITQGSKLMANGTASAPIVFTSNQAPGSRALGDWGGVILMGKASNNQPGGVAYIEGIAPNPDTQFGGGLNPDDTDNSGTLTYVRIEFPGYVYQPNKEINGLTLGSVGSGTTLHHIQVSFSNDDGFEWFGGAVTAHYLVSYRNLDDDFDTDFGFHGRLQFGLIVRDPNIADNPSVSTSEAFESDNDASGSLALPRTSAIFSNVTAIGPYRGNTAATVAPGFEKVAHIRRNSALCVYNGIFMDYKKGLYIDGILSEKAALHDSLNFNNNIIAGTATAGANCIVNTPSTGSGLNIWTYFGAHENDSIAATTGILVTPYDYLNPDYRPAASSPALTEYSFGNWIQPYTLQAPAATTAISYCANATPAQLSATATAGNTLQWYTVATGGTASTTAPTPSTATAGTFNYYVSQMNADGFEGPRTMITVTVNALPAAPSVTPNGPTSFCTGGDVQLTSSAATSYLWSNAATTQSITVSTSGSYHVTITDANGCQATSSDITVDVSSAPVPTVQASGSLAICAGSDVTLTSSTADTYLWSNGATTQSITVSTAGTYYVTTTNADACDGVGQSANQVVTVNVQPVAIVGTPTVVDNTVTFVNNSTGAGTYSWDFGDFNSSTAQNPTHVYPASGPYTVTLTVTNGNCSDDTTFVVNAVLGVQEINSISGMNLFPNPTSATATLAIEMLNAGQVEVVLMNANGQIVQTIANDTFEAGHQELTIDCSELTAGFYYTVVRNEVGTQIMKLSVVK